MAQRITGLETEYGCLIESSEALHSVLPRIRDWLFEKDRYGLIDLHDRDWDEPAGNGGFLFNGGRIYIDMGHMEYCTPECVSALDVVKYDRAGDHLLMEAVRALKLEKSVSFIRNNIDHHTGATFGCHENYSMSRAASLDEKNILSLLGFLTLRVLFCGAGRAGTVRAALFRGDVTQREEPVPFQMSQRADYIQNDFFEWVQHNRAIINTRDEPLADPRQYRRLHLLHGDTNVLPSSLYLKVGTTRLVLDLLEENDLPSVELQNAVSSLRSLSRCLKPPWRVMLSNGQTADALELLYQFHARAQKNFKGRDHETDCLLKVWKKVLDGLSTNTGSLIGIVDWITKRYLLEQFCESEGLEWGDPWLESQDLEYHQINPERSLGLAMADRKGPWEPDNVIGAMLEPPSDSRAHARSRMMREIQAKKNYYILDWESVESPGEKPRRLLNPFQP